jgi:hypothetical protein
MQRNYTANARYENETYQASDHRSDQTTHISKILKAVRVESTARLPNDESVSRHHRSDFEVGRRPCFCVVLLPFGLLAFRPKGTRIPSMAEDVATDLSNQ